MRLQGAIFTMDDTLFLPGTSEARADLDKALALLKMEGVWLGAVTAAASASLLMPETGMERETSLPSSSVTRVMAASTANCVPRSASSLGFMSW